MDNATRAEVKCNCSGVGGGVYGLAFIGALVYYWQQADSLQAGLFGLLKALLWPAFLIYRVLEFLNM